MKLKTTKDPGLGSKYQEPLKRIMNPDGTYNIRRVGGISKFRDFYKHLLECSWSKFLLYITSFYIIFNFIFTFLFLSVGIEELQGINKTQNEFFAVFFFSVQTLTTVGYGAMSPIGFGANVIAMVEAFVGVLTFALATGLLYGRFSRAETKIAFSRNIILTPFQDSMAMMFKMVNQRNNVLLNTKVNVMLIMDKGVGEDRFNKLYFDLELENDEVYFFPLTWTLVHKITEDSPLSGLTVRELRERNAEVVILVKTFDETYSQSLLKKHSYAQEQWKEDVKFATNFKTNAQGQVELYVDRIDDLIAL
ncbi:MAG: ion channel [Bacteroidota bacterium]